MSQSDVPSAAGQAAPGSFAARPASQAWERLAHPDDPGQSVWVWFKPPAVPQGLMFRIPDEAWQAAPRPAVWTLRQLLRAAGIEPQSVGMWQLHGAAYAGQQGANPLFDSAIPAPPPGVDPGIVVHVQGPQQVPQQMPGPQFAPSPAAPPMPGPAAAAAPAGSHAEVFKGIDTDWNAILELENEVKSLRKSLFDMTGRLSALNRDLSTDERLHADNLDTRDWLEARRALRDAGLRLSICIKEFDMGDVSSAGQRSWFEQIYEQFVVPGRPFDNMQQAQLSFAHHRKLVTVLQSKMSSALLHASNNGERRAQQILSRIAAKIRDAQNKKNFLGAMFDS